MTTPAVATVISTEFPFSYLIAEIVNYHEEQEATQSAAKKEWIARLEASGADNISNSDAILSNIVFGQSNCATRLESLGYRVGYSLAERLCKDLPRFPGELECVKFICKEFWNNVFGKQVDNLRTNHQVMTITTFTVLFQGIYVIQDNKFLLLTSFAEGTQYLDQAALYLAMPAGVLRGALSNLGIEAIVTPSSDSLPIARFNVTVQASEEEKPDAPPPT